MDQTTLDRKSTRLNSSHLGISYAVFCLKKKNEQHAAPDVIADEQQRHDELCVHPAGAGADAVAEPEPQAERDREDRARRHDAEEELALHYLEALAALAVCGLRVIDEQPREVEQAREPRHHEDDVQRLDPEHQLASLRRNSTVAA